MALMHVTARPCDLLVQDAQGRGAALAPVLRAVPRGAPVAVLIHGFKFRPAEAACDPHVQLYGAPAEAGALRCADWPAALGFSRTGRGDGLCLGFGWDARAGHRETLAARARNGFAAVYERAAGAGEQLAALMAHMAEIRPDLEIDLFAHSLGGRVALAALADPRARAAAGRALLLGAAEDARLARAALPADPLSGEGAQIYHMAARHNDAFDALFEAAAPRIDGRRPEALGRAGLGARRPDWIDLQLDSPDFVAWARGRGAPLSETTRRICHWSFYDRPGVMDLHRAILREREAWSIARLRDLQAPEGLAPRWSRIAPRLSAGLALGRLSIPLRPAPARKAEAAAPPAQRAGAAPAVQAGQGAAHPARRRGPVRPPSPSQTAPVAEPAPPLGEIPALPGVSPEEPGAVA